MTTEPFMMEISEGEDGTQPTATRSAGKKRPGHSAATTESERAKNPFNGDVISQLTDSIMKRVAEMMGSRIAAIEDRLLPQLKNVRPPLSTDRTNKQQTPPLQGRKSKPKHTQQQTMTYAAAATSSGPQTRQQTTKVAVSPPGKNASAEHPIEV